MAWSTFVPFSAETLGLYERTPTDNHVTQEFWDWADIHFGERTLLGEEYDSDVSNWRWYCSPDTRKIAGAWEHGREFRFKHSRDAMLFKLRWLGSV